MALPGSRISETRETTKGSAELKFRIQFPPADSPSLSGFRLRPRKDAGFGAIALPHQRGGQTIQFTARQQHVLAAHRLLVSGSDRSCEKWMSDYRIAGIDGLQLHHLYRAMAP